MIRRFASRSRRATAAASFGLALLVLAAAVPAEGQAIIKVGDTVSLKFGVLLQAWGDWMELPNAALTDTIGYQQNFYLRRARFLFAGRIAKDVYFWMETENSNLGKAAAPATNKALGSGLQLLTAWGEWRIADAFMLEGGLIRVPYSRIAMTAAGSQLVLDTPSSTYLQQVPTQSTGGNRDTGFLARGYFLAHRLEYRVGVFQGVRQTAQSKNSFRYTGRLQYELLDLEDLYSPTYIGSTSYAGSYLGDKKVLAIGTAFDTQKDYNYYSGDVFASIPLGGGSIESTFQYQYISGGTTFPTALPTQNTMDIDLGYYIKSAKLAPVFRYEQRVLNGQSKKDHRICGGLNWYPFKYNFNVKGLYQRITPTIGPALNEFTLQLQFYYW